MLLWIIIFLVVFLTSFILAYKSMIDYEENPFKSGGGYAPFLVRSPHALTQELINEFYRKALSRRMIISLERLFRGQRRALVIFGPQNLLLPYEDVLGLVELEDYSRRVNLPGQHLCSMVAWEVGTKKSPHDLLAVNDFTSVMPELGENEEFWWQIVLWPTGKGWEEKLSNILSGLIWEPKKASVMASKEEIKDKSRQPAFMAIIRAVAWSEEKKRVQELQSQLLKIGKNSGLVFLPQVLSSEKMLQLYQERSLPQANSPRFAGKSSLLSLTAREIISLLHA